MLYPGGSTNQLRTAYVDVLSLVPLQESGN